ncbi:extracellular solute-binding protein [Marispirochaeta sp.]|jgi:raffinose/stachyose/melibiose transport system substrate-binding protein|uniref:ABC transporter substrate-binding protein n=1 Tax=Marispirochaeta sp. TaxID=2038653 RepID=UPI0029C642C1|nr:extracellular solute-binding protein [Marispirochaeta sp.]
MKDELLKRCFWAVCLLLFVSGGIAFAGGAGEKGGDGEVVEIRHMSPHTAGAGFGEYFAAHVEKFNAENPNIHVIHDSLPSGDLRTKITVEMASGNPPNTSWLVLSYAREFMKDDLLMDWAPVFEDPAHPEFKERFSDTILYFSQDNKGRVMMAPFEVHMDGLFYNTEIFEKYGWKVPETFDEFVALGPKAREKGIALTVTGGKDVRFAWLASALMARAAGVENTNKLTIGDKLGEWDNPAYGFPQAMAKFAEMVKADVYPDGVLGISQNEADQMFVRGEAATYYEGQWRPGNWESLGGKEFIQKVRRVDFPAMPDMRNGDPKARVGGTIVGLIAAADQPEREKQASIEWIKSIESPEFWAPVLADGRNLYPGKVEYDKSNVSEVMLQCAEALLSAERLIPSMDTLAPPAIDLAIKKTAMPGIIAGQYTVDQAVAEVQKAAEEYLKSQGN